MLNQGNSQLLNKYDLLLKERMALNNLLHNVTNSRNSQNQFMNINPLVPPVLLENKNSNINIQGEFDETNFLNMINNLSIEPSNLKRSNISTPTYGQNLNPMKIPIGIGKLQNPQVQKFLHEVNYPNDIKDQTLLLKQVLLLKLINNNQINNQNYDNNYLNSLEQNIINSKINNQLFNNKLNNFNSNNLQSINNLKSMQYQQQKNNLLNQEILNRLANKKYSNILKKNLNNQNILDPSSLIMNNNLNMNQNIINNYYNENNNNLLNNNIVNINDYNNRLEGLYDCIYNIQNINNINNINDIDNINNINNCNNLNNNNLINLNNIINNNPNNNMINNNPNNNKINPKNNNENRLLLPKLKKNKKYKLFLIFK